MGLNNHWDDDSGDNGRSGGKEDDDDNESKTKNMMYKKVDSKWTRQVNDKKKVLFGDNWSKEQKRHNKFGIILKKMQESYWINRFHCSTLIYYTKEIELIFTSSSGDHDYDKNSIASPSIDKRRNDQQFFQVLPMLCLTGAKCLKCKLDAIWMIYVIVLIFSLVLINI